METSIVKQIEQKEARIAELQENLERLQKQLRARSHHLPPEQRKKLEKDVTDMKDQLDSFGKDLKYLRRENQKSMFVALILLGIIVIVYYWWQLS